MNAVRVRWSAGFLLLAAAVLAAAGCHEKRPQAVATPPPVVLVSRPVERTVTDYQVFTARTQAVQSVEVKPRVTGYLTKVLFKDGAEVKEGDQLFQIDERPYKAALDKANGDLARLQGQRKYIDSQLARYQKLLADQAGSQQDVDNFLGQQAENIGATAVAKAQIALAELNYGWCKVNTPIAGRINRHFVDVGNLVTQDVTTLTNIVSIKPIWAYFDVDANTAARYQELVLKGEVPSPRANVIPVAMGLAGNQDFPVQGVIDFVSNQFDPNTGSIRLRAVFPNETQVLEAGMFGRVRVPISAPHPALLVADSAIGTNQGQQFLCVVNDQDEVEYRIVNVGELHGGLREVMRTRTVVRSGPDGKEVFEQVEVLKPADRVIVDGLQRVRPGTRVEPKAVDMTTLLPVGEPELKRAAPKSK